MSIRPVFTREANAECEQRIRSNAYVLDVEGKMMRHAEKDFLICAYSMSKGNDLGIIDTKPAKYRVA